MNKTSFGQEQEHHDRSSFTCSSSTTNSHRRVAFQTMMRRISHIQRILQRDSRQILRLAACHGTSGEFVGDVEGIDTTWRPHGALKDHQDSLPRQPVPPLSQTMETFLGTVRPILNDDKYKRALKLTADFARPGGTGEKLQALLQRRADARENWLADYWIKLAYLGYRDPVSIFVNPFFAGPPMPQFSGKKGMIRAGALVISTVLEHKAKVDSQTVPIEVISGVPQCMTQYYHVLGSTRIPGEKQDHVVTHHAHDVNPPRHVTVTCNNNIFHVEVLDESMKPLSVEQLEKQLEHVWDLSRTRAPPVAALSSHNRDKCYTTYKELQKDPVNASHLESISRSLFLLGLDQSPPDYTADSHYESMLRANMAGGGSDLNTGNRWCDKLLQVYVNENGTFGFAYEHSVAEGPPLLLIVEQCLKTLENPSVCSNNPTKGSYESPKKLDFNVSPSVQQSIDEAGASIHGIGKKIDIKTTHYTNYGRDFIKQLKLPPDGFMQGVIQLAYYNMYGKLVSTYESGSLRKFRLGRTETIRSVSVPVLEWCQAMNDENLSAQDKLELLREAVKYHRWYTNQASQGQAVDRHLLGLKLVALDHNVELPELLTDPIYTQSVHWNLSTTTVPLSSLGVVCFAPVVEDGYGIYYNCRKDGMTFGVTAWNTCPTTNVYKLSSSLRRALDDTHVMCSNASNN